MPVREPRTAFYWEAIDAGRIDLLRCRQCGHYVHYPRPICDRCRSEDLAPSTVSGMGSLYSYCEVVHPSHPYFAERLPYLIGVIDIVEEPGIHLCTGLVDCSYAELRCGMAMEPVFRDVTPTLKLVYFRPQARHAA